MPDQKRIQVQIHPLQALDIPVIRDLAQRIWPVSYAGILTPEQIADMLQMIYNPANLTIEMQSGHRFWSAAVEGAPVGFCSAYREDAWIWIKKLYVLPARHGMGIGRALIGHAQAAFMPAKELRLLVNPKNHAAQQFYTKAGFHCIGREPVTMGGHAFLDMVFARPI